MSVDIYDQVYHLRGTDAEYIERLAALVDGKMRAVAAHGSTVDSLRVAVLAALNISDELLALRARYDALAGSMGQTEVTHALARGNAGGHAGRGAGRPSRRLIRCAQRVIGEPMTLLDIIASLEGEQPIEEGTVASECLAQIFGGDVLALPPLVFQLFSFG